MNSRRLRKMLEWVLERVIVVEVLVAEVRVVEVLVVEVLGVAAEEELERLALGQQLRLMLIEILTQASID